MPYDESVGANENENWVVFHVVGSSSGNISEKRTIQYLKSYVRKRFVKYPLKTIDIASIHLCSILP